MNSKSIITFNKLFLGVFVLFSLNVNSELKIENSLEIPSVPISKSISAIVRVVCFETNTYVLASNSHGSDMELVSASSCESNEVLEYSFIFGESLGSNSSGIMREIVLNEEKFVVYSPKGKSPIILGVK